MTTRKASQWLPAYSGAEGWILAHGGAVPLNGRRRVESASLILPVWWAALDRRTHGITCCAS